MDPVDALRAACPALRVRDDPAVRDAAGIDALRPFRGRPDFAAVRTRPLAVVEPGDTAQVAALVRWAEAARVPLVVRGGGSGLVGGAAVLRPSVLIDLTRLRRVDVQPDAGLVRAGAGAVLRDVAAALAPHRLLLGHDPWTVGVATVGGVLSTNGLGYLGARAGSVRHQVRGVEAVLTGGRIVRTPAVPARSTGPDLTQLLAGAEGTLGIVTEVTLAVLPEPEERVVQSHRLPSFDAGVAFAIAARRAGIRPVCLELDADALPPAPASLLLVFDGLRGEATLHATRAAALAASLGGERRPDDEAAGEWAERHAIAERWAASAGFREGDWLPGGARGQFDYAHVGVPVARLAAVRGVAHALVRDHGLQLVEEGLWHWPELYSIVVAGGPADAVGVRAAIDGTCRAAQDAGGTMEYCHGVGWKLAHLMEHEHGPALDLLRRLKATFDPHGVFNPGKAGLST